MIHQKKKNNFTITSLKIKKNILEKRALIIDAIRSFFKKQNFLEVDTPMRISCPAPEYNIDLLQSGDKFLIASPELQMKKLISAGFKNIFQICHCFRANERGTNHLEEFTMLEWYRTEGTMHNLMQDCEQLIKACAKAIDSYPLITRNDHTINLSPPWPAKSVNQAFSEFANWQPGPNPDPLKFDMDMVDKIEPALPENSPIFLTHYPAAMASLAKLSPDDPSVAMRFELYAGGLELANGFEELTDAKEQKERFEKEEQKRRADNKTPYSIDNLFLKALEHNQSPFSGIALGVDRLVMLLTNTLSISDTVALSDE
jgi:lysyl-tRNA synthetase class 2